MQLFSVGDSIDTRTAAGRLVLNVLMSVDQSEREAIGERTRDSLQHKISKGERCGQVPFGFNVIVVDDVQFLEPNVEEQQAIQLMHELRAAGKSYPAIVAELQARGIQSKEGKTWQPTTVRKILLRSAQMCAA